jgi:alpha-glucosidase
MTLPGVPTVFAGDELGLTGVDGEHARTPFPWHRREDWDEPTLQAYRSWTALRRGSVALRRGGLRWVFAGDDAMTFLREHRDERVLVHVSRADHPPVVLPLRALGIAGQADLRLLSGSAAEVADGELRLPAHGPAASAYVLG